MFRVRSKLVISKLVSLNNLTLKRFSSKHIVESKSIVLKCDKSKCSLNVQCGCCDTIVFCTGIAGALVWVGACCTAVVSFVVLGTASTCWIIYKGISFVFDIEDLTYYNKAINDQISQEIEKFAYSSCTFKEILLNDVDNFDEYYVHDKTFYLTKANYKHAKSFGYRDVCVTNEDKIGKCKNNYMKLEKHHKILSITFDSRNS